MNRSLNAGVSAFVLMLTMLLAGVSTSTPAQDATVKMPAGYSLAGTGSRQDFDFLAGAWVTHQRRLKTRNKGSSEWADAPSNVHCATPYLDGLATAE